MTENVHHVTSHMKSNKLTFWMDVTWDYKPTYCALIPKERLHQSNNWFMNYIWNIPVKTIFFNMINFATFGNTFIKWQHRHMVFFALDQYTCSLVKITGNSQAMAMAPLELTQVQEYQKEWL